MFKAYYASSPTAKLVPFEFDPGALKPDQVEIKIEHCGICYSDLSMLKNDWGMTQYPFVPGHEVVGTVTKLGSAVNTHKIGQRVGVGWFSGSCASCGECLSGNHNLCATNEQTIVGRHGGFASHIRVQSLWATPIPESLPANKIGPLFCGGITVFNPLVQSDVKPLDRVGVIGIGGLGHLALQFCRAWGCEVTAFSSTAAKAEEAKKFGAHQVLDSKSASDMQKIAGSLDFILSTVNADLDWMGFLGTLAPKGRLHFVGAVSNQVALAVFPMLSKQSSVSATPLGSPYNTRRMLEFCARHKIAPTVEFFPMSKVNQAMEHLRAGKARYRIILTNDIG